MDVVWSFLIDLVGFLPALIAISIFFDFVRSILFQK